MNVFEAVKQSVTTRQAAEHYGIHVGRNGMACCPFHNDKTPSMKLDRRYHCFGCGADGDVIDFAAARHRAEFLHLIGYETAHGWRRCGADRHDPHPSALRSVRLIRQSRRSNHRGEC